MKKILVLLLILITFAGCEKDDICDASENTTPSLVIEFYDSAFPTIQRNVVNLKAVAVGQTDGIVFNTALPVSDPTRYLFNGNKVKLPLKSDTTTTQYNLTINFGNANPAFVNNDKLTINYTTNSVYVSRACGYATNFTLSGTTPLTVTDAPNLTNLWINSITILTSTINNENETHVKIFL